MKTLLIDADEYLFKACAAVEKEVRWDEWNHVLFSNREEAWANFVRMIEALFEKFETREHALCFSAPPNFRYQIAEDYKGGRKGSRKPLCYAALRELCEEHYNVVAFAGLEADDVMGILATKPATLLRMKPIIISQDKDMKTIPGQVWREGDLKTIQEAEADYWHFYQTLIGDPTDGFKGCPGVGPKKAEAILNIDLKGAITMPAETKGIVWRAIVAAYEKAKLTEEDALKQARLARILRWSDWDSKEKTPILWNPPTLGAELT